MPIPEDKKNFVYILFILHGIGILMPWNIIITASDYFSYKLKVDENSVDRLKNYNTNFYSYLGIGAKAPNLLFMIINMFLPKSCGSLSARMLFSLFIQLIVMVFTTVLAVIDTRDYTETFFWLTIISNAIMNMGSGIYQSSAFGTAGNMPLTYINALSLGINLSGVISCVFDIASKAIAPDPMWMAVIYFSSVIIVLIMCIVMEIILRSNEFRVYYRKLAEKEQMTDQNLKDIAVKEDKNKHKEQAVEKIEDKNNIGNKYVYVFKKISVQLLNIFLIFFVSFSIFPPIIASVESSDNLIPEKYYGSVFCFLIFQTSTFMGTITADFFRYPTPETMIAFTSIRLLFIPFYLFFNYRPPYVERKLPVLIKSDLVFLLANFILGLTNGHLPALTLMYAPKQVLPKYASIAGMMSSLMILVGILAAFYFSFLFPLIIR